MATVADVRKMALALPEAVEQDHHGIPSFRVAGKIFCSIHLDRPRLMLKLDLETQQEVCEDLPELAEPVPGYWGKHGATFVAYGPLPTARLKTLLRVAWTTVAPRRRSEATSATRRR